ncbi:MAG: hypothetical protein ABIK28_11745 [Planctomycetota bacterium]
MKFSFLSMLIAVFVLGGLIPIAIAGAGDRATHTVLVDDATATW